jgi:hypothetical protein
MGWNDYYRRRDVMESVLRRARRDAQAEVPFDEIDGAAEVFGNRQNLLLALHYKWSQILGGHLRTELAGQPDDADLIDAARVAWRRAVNANPTLRALLDANVDRFPALRSAHEAELRMLALTAGLADGDEPATEITRIGATFEALLRNTPARSSGRWNTVGRLLRQLVASA